VTLLSIFDAVEAMFRPLQPAARSCASWLSNAAGGPIGCDSRPCARVDRLRGHRVTHLKFKRAGNKASYRTSAQSDGSWMDRNAQGWRFCYSTGALRRINVSGSAPKTCLRQRSLGQRSLGPPCGTGSPCAPSVLGRVPRLRSPGQRTWSGLAHFRPEVNAPTLTATAIKCTFLAIAAAWSSG
jgi:hypothetical protein